MSQGTWTTTAEEDAAILALNDARPKRLDGPFLTPPETVEEFITRHIRHQIDFALSLVKETRKTLVESVSPQDLAQIDAILEKYKASKVK